MFGAVILLFAGLVLFYYLLARPRPFSKNKDARRPPIQQVLASPNAPRYELHSDFDTPPATGLFLKLLTRFGFSRLGQWSLVPHLLRKVNIAAMEGVFLPDKVTFHPTPPYPPPISQDYAGVNRNVLGTLFKQYMSRGKDENDAFRLPTVADYRRAYESGQCTPTDVVEAALTAIELSNSLSPPLRAIIDSQRSVALAMAAASTERWKTGKTLSLLDGIPISLKGGVCVEPYICYCGTAIANAPEIVKGLKEAPTAQKLKEAGAVIIGMANLQEFGAGTLGSNPNSRHLTCRNPYDTGYYCGGSSSGSSASVAAGICPVSIGTDGGGSVRIPASLCGVVGLKPTFGLLDTEGICPATVTVGMMGPIASSVLDTALMMDILSRETDGERVLSSLEGIDSILDMTGVKVGVYWDYFNHADAEVIKECKKALSVLESLGAEVVEVIIPELESSRMAHFVSIFAEMSQSLGLDIEQNFSVINPETLIVIGSAMQISSSHYLIAQRQRTRSLAILEHVFNDVDVIVTPTTACVSKRIPSAAIQSGELDGATSGRLIRFAFLANLCGNPALTLPVGYAERTGLPIGFQLMGRHYEERVLLRLGLALEQSGLFPAKKPLVFYDLLQK